MAHQPLLISAYSLRANGRGPCSIDLHHSSPWISPKHDSMYKLSFPFWCTPAWRWTLSSSPARLVIRRVLGLRISLSFSSPHPLEKQDRGYHGRRFMVSSPSTNSEKR